jgi:PmbA protein
MIEKKPSDKWPEQAGEDFLAGGPRDLDQAESLMEEALLAGAEDAEVYLKSSRTTGIFLQHGFATLTGGNERGVALRVFDGKGGWGHAHASWGEPSLSRRLVGDALAALKNLSGESAGPLAPAPRLGAPLPQIDGVIDSRILRAAPEQKRDILEGALREISRESDPALGTALRDGVSRVALVNSRGLKVCFHRTLALLTLTLSRASGPTLVAEHVGSGIGREEISETAREILRLRDAKHEEVIAPQCLLLKSTAALVLMRWLQREILPEDLEPAQDARRIASEAIDLVDDPLLDGGVASAPFDGEGYPSRRKTLLKSGIRIGSLNENRAGSEEGSRWVRPSYREVPAPGATNLLVLPGRRSCSEMTSGMERGLLLAALDSDGGDSQPAVEAQWRGIGWEVRDGRVAGDCRMFLFRAAPRHLLEGVVEVSSGQRFSLRRSTALGCADLLIRPRV